jgi:DNA-directed RNA polymerase specialized sigma24 family protein
MRPLRSTAGSRLAAAIAAEKLDEFGNPIQPRWLPGESRNSRIDAKRKRDDANDVDTDVDDDNFVSDSSASDGESERDNSDVQEVSNEVRNIFAQIITLRY